MEWRIMSCLWQHGEGTAQQVAERLAMGRRRPIRGVHVRMVRLLRRGLLTTRRERYTTVYSATVTREQVRRWLFLEIAASLAERIGAGLLSGMVETGHLDAGELQVLRPPRLP